MLWRRQLWILPDRKVWKATVKQIVPYFHIFRVMMGCGGEILVDAIVKMHIIIWSILLTYIFRSSLSQGWVHTNCTVQYVMNKTHTHKSEQIQYAKSERIIPRTNLPKRATVHTGKPPPIVKYGNVYEKSTRVFCEYSGMKIGSNSAQ